MERMLGLDVGDVRIGIAVSDPLMITAQGVETYTRKDPDKDIEFFKNLITENNISKIICGLPKNMDGSIGEQAHKTMEYAEMLHKNTGLSIIYWDERLTTKSALRTLAQAEIKKNKQKNIKDKLAAVYILQSYIDSIRFK